LGIDLVGVLEAAALLTARPSPSHIGNYAPGVSSSCRLAATSITLDIDLVGVLEAAALLTARPSQSHLHGGFVIFTPDFTPPNCYNSRPIPESEEQRHAVDPITRKQH
jgi:hypothetical protein